MTDSIIGSISALNPRLHTRLCDLVGTGVAMDREAVLEVGVDVGHRLLSAP